MAKEPLTPEEIQDIWNQDEGWISWVQFGQAVAKAQLAKALIPDIEDLKNKWTFELGEIARQATNKEVEKAKQQESEAITRCIKDAKRVHPDWGVDDIISLLGFREETREAIKNQKGWG